MIEEDESLAAKIEEEWYAHPSAPPKAAEPKPPPMPTPRGSGKPLLKLLDEEYLENRRAGKRAR